MIKKTLFFCCITILMVTSCKSTRISSAQAEQEKNQIINIIHLVNNYWQSNNKPQTWAFWDNAAYHTGNMEAYFLTKEPAYLKYSEDWAIHNEWKGAKSDNKSEWKYNHYGEGHNYVLFGDWQICFQTYIDLYNIEPADHKIARALEVMEYQINSDKNDYWWWVDGLYMVMPVMTRLYKLTGNELYLDRLYEYYQYAESIMYDPETALFYRDAKYIYPKHKSTNGLKDFWARGDGWLLAGLAKIIPDLPDSYVHKQKFIKQFTDMAATLIQIQQPEGYWTRSMLDPEHAPGPETSGTAFFTYGLQWGVNNGLLKEKNYQPAIDKAWNYLTNTALQASGKVGYVQPIGERAIPGQVIDANSQSNFGVGAFLLAACERYRYFDKK